MDRRSVIENLCQTKTMVYESLDPKGLKSCDCICAEGAVGFSHDFEVLQYIRRAVAEKLYLDGIKIKYPATIAPYEDLKQE